MVRQSTFVQIQRNKPLLIVNARNKFSGLLKMRDSSCAYWFKVGDFVRVVEDVYKGGNINLRDRIGKVIETWEKCEVDPTCCCAEQVDLGMAVHVRFERDLNECLEGVQHSFLKQDFFVHYFAEEELIKVKDHQQTNGWVEEPKDRNELPFDGLSCQQYKLQQLGVEGKSRKIASFEPGVSE